WTTQNRSAMSTELPDSSPVISTNTVTEWKDPSTTANITDANKVSEEWPPVSEFRTVRDLTVTKLTEQEHIDQDTTESTESNTDSAYISTTDCRAGECALLSITSNSTSSYVEGSSSPETAPHASTGQLEKTDVTQYMEYTEDTSHSEATAEDFSTNVTQKEVFNTEVSSGSEITQSNTRQPTVTGTDFESMPKTSNPSSTPPLIVINSSVSEMDSTSDFSTNQMFYTNSSSSSSSISPFVLPDNTPYTNVSHQDSETTDAPIGHVSTSSDEEPDEPKTFMEETTISSLTTAPFTTWDMTTSVDESKSTQQTLVSQTDNHPEPTEALSTAAGPLTHVPPIKEEDTHKTSTVSVTSTTLDSTGTTATHTTQQSQTSTTPEAYSTTHSTLSSTETTQKITPTSEQQHTTNLTATPFPLASSSQSGVGATDVSTLHFETSTATPSSTSANSQHTTAFYTKSIVTTSTAVITTEKRAETEASTTPGVFSQAIYACNCLKDHMCRHHICANGGKCVLTSDGYRCDCLPAWRGENCTEDVDECVSNPCPQDSVCVNTRGSFSCDCPLGYDLQDGRSCTQTKTFLGIIIVNTSLHESHREILKLLNYSLFNLPGYRRSTLLMDRLHILAVNMFSMSANVTSIDIFHRIQMSLQYCNKPQSHCSLKHQHRLMYQMGSLCSVQKNRCDTQYAVCNDTDGTPYCQCHEGYFKKNTEDSTCRDCGDGFKLVNGTCMECPFGFGGFNCNNFYGLIAKVVSPAAGGLLLIVIIALIITCCRKDKNDINKIIFKSGDLQMSPYGEFPKSNRVSMEWGRETIEMQENGSTKNLLQMTDIYYSPALRNADLERNGLYPFSGLPGSRHSCIYPAQWNPSFISDDSRRRDYF
ncbi:protein HEG precursor, partial [Silurus asotus]